MFIARLKTLSLEDKKSVLVKTFAFETEDDLNKALYHLKKCKCPIFAAETKTKDSKYGRMIGTWNTEATLSYWQGYTTEYGRYKDHCWTHFGTEEECLKWADETNEKAVSYFCTSASVCHTVGELWQVNYCSPYND